MRRRKPSFPVWPDSTRTRTRTGEDRHENGTFTHNINKIHTRTHTDTHTLETLKHYKRAHKLARAHTISHAQTHAHLLASACAHTNAYIFTPLHRPQPTHPPTDENDATTPVGQLAGLVAENEKDGLRAVRRSASEQMLPHNSAASPAHTVHRATNHTFITRYTWSGGSLNDLISAKTFPSRALTACMCDTIHQPTNARWQRAKCFHAGWLWGCRCLQRSFLSSFIHVLPICPAEHRARLASVSLASDTSRFRLKTRLKPMLRGKGGQSVVDQKEQQRVPRREKGGKSDTG
jgi:hypothetical protein